MIKFELNQEVMATGGIITNGGLVGTIIHLTKTQLTMKVNDLFFPVHVKPISGKFQVSKDNQEHQRNIVIGQTRKFWIAGTRKFFEIGNRNDTFQRKLIVDECAKCKLLQETSGDINEECDEHTY